MIVLRVKFDLFIDLNVIIDVSLAYESIIKKNESKTTFRENIFVIVSLECISHYLAYNIS